MIRYAAECRGCGRQLQRTLPEQPRFDQTRNVRIRCRDCGATNHASVDGDALVRGESA